MSLQPEPDSEFHRRLAEALRGGLRGYTAPLPAAGILPFDPRFRLVAGPGGVGAVPGGRGGGAGGVECPRGGGSDQETGP